MKALTGGEKESDLLTSDEPGFSWNESEDGQKTGPVSKVLAKAGVGLNALVSPLLNLILAKPIAIFVWWLASGANQTTFRDRARLLRRVNQARKEGRPVLFASNHVSMFDDPVIPMALFRTGPRASAECALLVLLLILWCVVPPTIVPPAILLLSFAACCLGSALLGARKTWWSTGDLLNFSGVSALRTKMEAGRDRPLSMPIRVALAVADPLIFLFMRSATVRTVLVDRRTGEASRRSRGRALDAMIDIAARGEQLWIFFEGGRARNPDEIRPAKAGIGHVIERLNARQIRPLVIAVHHRGLEKVIPMSPRAWLTTGHRIEISWSVVALEGERGCDVSSRNPQTIADDVRAAVVRLQSTWRSESALPAA